ncbi:retrovirus-related pol polyprotein from transposon TNT 1-94 [Tanacetum coccineum]
MLNPWYIGPFKILDRVGPVAYKLELPEELSNVYNTFHVSNLKKCLSDESLIIPIKELQLDDKLNFVEKPIEIIDREVKQLKQSCIPIVKEKVFVITTLKNDLRKFKGKDIGDNAAQVSNATTIFPGMYKLDPIVDQAKSLNPLDSASYSACKYVKLIQELLGYVRDTCSDIHKPSEKLVAVTPINKKKTVRITATNKVPLRELIPLEVVAQESIVVQIVLWYLDSGCSKHKTGDRSQLTNFVYKFLSTVKFCNDQIVKIIGYGDYQIGNITISRVYYVEGLRHNLFSVGQFCDSYLEVAFRKHTCFVCNLEASKTKSWLWHRRLSHMNFGAINHLAKNGLVRGLPKLKFEKDHLCSACVMGKSKKQSHKPKSEDTNQEKLYLFHMDLCGPMRVSSINGKKYILFIVDNYSRFTWVKFLASKDEAPDFIIKFLKMIQVRLNTPVKNIRRDNGTEFFNQTLHSYYESVSISHETLVARSPQQNGVVERRNRTLVKVARIMLIYAKAPLFLWVEAVATALLCYPNNDNEDLGNLEAKRDIGIFIGYTPKKKDYCIYNRRLVKNLIPQQPCNLPPRDDWNRLFQPMFDEYFNPPTIVVSSVPVDNAPRVIDLADSTVSTSIDQDAPSTSISSTQDQEHSLIISQGFKESPKTPHFHDDPLHESLYKDSTSQGSSSNVRNHLVDGLRIIL